MTLADYERAGGFKEELMHLRAAGEELVPLREKMQARQHRDAEFRALENVCQALMDLQAEIVLSRCQATATAGPAKGPGGLPRTPNGGAPNPKEAA